MTPVVAITVYNRPDYLKRVLDSWHEAEQFSLTCPTYLVGLEPGGPPEIEQILEAFRHGDRNVSIHHNDTVLGPLENPYQVLARGFDHDDFVICAEDDTVVAPDVFEFFSSMESSLRYATGCLAVCAYNRLAGVNQHCVQLKQQFYTSVWGTWIDRWTDILEPTWDHDYSSGPVHGHQQGWDWNIGSRIMPERHLRCAIPDISRSQHIGKYGGAHMQPDRYWESVAQTFAGDLGWAVKNFYVMQEVS